MILVTGGAGFIGSNLVAELSDRGERVAVCDRLGNGPKWKNLAGHELADLIAPEQLGRFLRGSGRAVEHVFHLGAITSTSETDADLVTEVNFRLSQRIWRWCTRAQVPLVYASSAATYGDGSFGFEDDESPAALARLLPLNPYAWSKHLFDRWVTRELLEGQPKPPQWAGLKFFNVYGPNEDHKEDMRSLVTKAYPSVAAGASVRLFRSHDARYPDGGQLRDFVYVRDCVAVMLWLRENPEVNGLFNLGTGRAQTWVALMEALYRAAGREPRIEFVDTPQEIRDSYQYFTEARMEKLRDAGYSAPFASVEEGVADYVERFLAKGLHR